MVRPLPDLIDESDDAIHLIREWMAESPSPVELLDCSAEAGARALSALQVTTRSPLGALAYHSGGLSIDDGWLRVWGAGSPRLPRAIDTWNGLGTSTHRFDSGLVIADDALGGFYAWFSKPRAIHYFAPDTFRWEDTEHGYTSWLQLMLGDGLAAWYEELRWTGWRDEVRALEPDQGIHVWPPLVMRGAELLDRSRRAVPVEELWGLGGDIARQLAGVEDGQRARLVVRNVAKDDRD